MFLGRKGREMGNTRKQGSKEAYKRSAQSIHITHMAIQVSRTERRDRKLVVVSRRPSSSSGARAASGGNGAMLETEGRGYRGRVSGVMGQSENRRL